MAVKKQSSPSISSLASSILAGRTTPTQQQVRKLAASVLSQDEKPGQALRTPKPAPTKKR